jgi:hypothetical protein
MSKVKQNDKSIEQDWFDYAFALALWAWQFLVNRVDIWGAHTRAERLGQDYTTADGKIKKVPSRYTKHGRLREHRLVRHFRGALRHDLVGVHTTSPEGRCLFGCYDIDAHGPADPAANLRMAYALYDCLREKGLNPLLTTSDGCGGYHVWVVFAEPVAVADLYAFLEAVAQEVGYEGEWFPKQPALPQGGCGNWVRLPGAHPSGKHWSTVYNGERWLEGEEAIQQILTYRGDDVGLIPKAPPVPPVKPCCTMQPSSRLQPLRVTAGNNLEARIEAYMATLPNLKEGDGRNSTGFTFAAWLTHDMAQSDTVALDWLERWDAANLPPLGKADLEGIRDNAKLYGKRPTGCGLESTAYAGVDPLKHKASSKRQTTAADPAEICHDQRHVLFKEEVFRQGKLVGYNVHDFRKRCDRNSCPACLRLRNRLWHEHLSQQFAKATTPIYGVAVESQQWSKLRTQLCRARKEGLSADYVLVKLPGAWWLQTTFPLEGAEALEAVAAALLLQKKIAQIVPRAKRCRLVTSSRPWKLQRTKDRPEPRDGEERIFSWLGTVLKSPAEIAEYVARRGLQREVRATPDGLCVLSGVTNLLEVSETKQREYIRFLTTLPFGTLRVSWYKAGKSPQEAIYGLDPKIVEPGYKPTG